MKYWIIQNINHKILCMNSRIFYTKKHISTHCKSNYDFQHKPCKSFYTCKISKLIMLFKSNTIVSFTFGMIFTGIPLLGKTSCSCKFIYKNNLSHKTRCMSVIKQFNKQKRYYTSAIKLWRDVIFVLNIY